MPIIKRYTAVHLFLISLGALFLGHTMINKYFPSEILNLIGLGITSYFIFSFTLKKNDVFAFIMVIYFCSLFPYLSAKGGGFNLVSLVCVILYYYKKRQIPSEIYQRDRWFNNMVAIFIVSSILGWIFNYSGTNIELVYSILTFFGSISLLMVSSRLVLNKERIKTFIQLNIILLIYSTVASVNKYLNIIGFETPMMPRSGSDEGYFEGGGLVGSSPLYGEYSMILLLLFAIFLMYRSKQIGINKLVLSLSVFLSFVNVFMSISRSVFMLSILGLAIIIFFQHRIIFVSIQKLFFQFVLLIMLGTSVLVLVKGAGLGYVFERVEEIEERNSDQGGVSIKRIIDGSAFNRQTAFSEGYKRYESKDSWMIGYGWGLLRNNREAFFVDPTIERTTAHSQLFAILFLFGWIGFICYFGLIIRAIYLSYKLTGSLKADYFNRLMGYFFMIAFSLFLLNEIKADSVSNSNYFTFTLVWLGIAYSIVNQERIALIKRKSIIKSSKNSLY